MSTSIPNDRISKILRSQVPKNLRGSDRFLDIITWNIRFFNQRDRKRVRTIRNLMEELNADIFVLQEIEEGALDGIAEDPVCGSGNGALAAYRLHSGAIKGGDRYLASQGRQDPRRRSKSLPAKDLQRIDACRLKSHRDRRRQGCLTLRTYPRTIC
ncbi:MAG: hypothetical protein HC770_01455 [Pseudanabaena sp. CRU_2_10]|nr:hypothetical protein [Pseudanabaena sp. CRU_2_10]